MANERDRTPGWGRSAAFALLTASLLAVGPSRVAATPYDFIQVNDPIVSELRVLDLYRTDRLQGRIKLPHQNTWPLQAIELQGMGPPPGHPPAVIGISLARVERALGRDRAAYFAPHFQYSSTPRILDYGYDTELFQLSLGVEGSASFRRDRDPRLASGSGLHGRIALGLDKLQAYSHYIVGPIDNARAFADPIVPNNDLIVLPDETYLSYTEGRGQWSMQFGRTRWHWGPGEEGSLVLSKTAPIITGLTFNAHLNSLHADFIAVSATLKQAAGEQLAGHRIEWQPAEALRIGVTETARYQSTGWKPLYLVGAIPYVLVQRLEREYEIDSLRAVRNNVLTAMDATWRMAEGLRSYGEILIDDLHARSGKNPNKFAFQFGAEGAWPLGPGRFLWGGEFTRVTRYVYTSFFGRDHALGGQSLGFPTGPDARRLRLRGAWDVNPDWGISVIGTRTNKGENDIDEPFLTRSPRVNSSLFEGVVETTTEVELGLRWWPASGVDVAVSGGNRWVDAAGHVRGASQRVPFANIQLQLMR
jgi:hypothetical protein